MARKPQHATIVGLLLKHGAEGKEHALMVAVSMRDAPMTTNILEHGNLSRSTLSEALESAKKGGYRDILTLLEQAGAKPRVELSTDEAQLARYAGTYRTTGGAELVLAVTGGRLIAGPPQRLTLVARDETTFWIVESTGMTITFRLEDGKAIALTLSRNRNTTTYSRVENR